MYFFIDTSHICLIVIEDLTVIFSNFKFSKVSKLVNTIIRNQSPLEISFVYIINSVFSIKFQEIRPKNLVLPSTS